MDNKEPNQNNNNNSNDDSKKKCHGIHLLDGSKCNNLTLHFPPVQLYNWMVKKEIVIKVPFTEFTLCEDCTAAFLRRKSEEEKNIIDEYKGDEYIKGAILGSFFADSLALGAHWVYDSVKLKNSVGNAEVESDSTIHTGGLRILIDPMAPYHPKKSKGNFTHYGDQALILLKSISNSNEDREDYENNEFDICEFAKCWFQALRGDNFDGYLDSATKAVLTNSNGKSLDEVCHNVKQIPNFYANDSHDLGGPSRIAPLLLLNKRNNLEKLIDGCIRQTEMTHRNETLNQICSFFATVVHLVLGGNDIPNSIEKYISDNEDSKLISFITKGKKSVKKLTVDTIDSFGKNCPYQACFPGTIHCLLKFGCEEYIADNPQQAFLDCLAWNTIAGGDSAARGLLIGLVFGARIGFENLPLDLLEQMVSYNEIVEIIDSNLS